MLRILLLLTLCLSRLVYAQHIMAPEEIKRIESHLPILEPGIVRSVIESPDGIWYDRKSMGVAYQLGGGRLFNLEFQSTGRIGIASGMLNVSPDFPENTKANGFGGNISAFDFSSFPWNPKPGGTHRSPNVSSVKRFFLPKKPDGSYWPVIVYEAELEGFQSPRPTVTGLDWTFPQGAVFLEPIAINDPESGQHYICAIRARIREEDRWVTEVMQPFRTSLELEDRIKQLEPKWRDSLQLVSFINYLSNHEPVAGRLRDNTSGNANFGTRPGDAFNVAAKIDRLPALPRELVAKLLDTTPFKAGAGYEWKPGCYAPTTNEPFHIVPQYYDGTFVGSDSTSCANCHNGAQISARRHESGNQKYGWLRGNKEGILSWHPFDPSALTRGPNPDAKLRKEWVEKGLVAFYDPEKHPKSVYVRITSPLGDRK